MAEIISVGVLTGSLDSVDEILIGSLSPVNPVLKGSLSTNIITSDYTEGYEVVSKPFEDQVLRTTNRVLINDILVKKIPIYETSNQFGGTTVNIGG